MEISVSGLKTIEKKLDVISHNIANLQTEGFIEKTPIVQELASGGVEFITTKEDSSNKENNVNIEKQLILMNENELYYKSNMEMVKTKNNLGNIINELI